MLSLFYAIFLELFSFAIQLSTSGMAIYWAKSDFVVVSHPFPFTIAFSLLIIISIVQFLIFLLLMFYSRSNGFLWTWIALLFSFFLVSIFLVSPLSLKSWVSQWNIEWTNTSHTMSFQYESNCCGWEDFKDRAISDCPFSYRSGCKEIVTKWIDDKYIQLYASLLLCSVVTLFPIVVIFYAFFALKPDTFWSIISLPFVNLLRETHD